MCWRGVGGDREQVIIIKEKDTYCKVIHRTGGFSDVCQISPRSRLSLVVVHSGAWEQSWKRLGNQAGFWCVFYTNRKAGFEENLQMVTHTHCLENGCLPAWNWLPPHTAKRNLEMVIARRCRFGNCHLVQPWIWLPFTGLSHADGNIIVIMCWD